LNIIEAIQDQALFGGLFKDISTWRPWLVFLRALFGLPIEDTEDMKLFRDCTGLLEPPRDRIRECAAICGRRSGKSFISALVAVFLACFKDWTPFLNRGERGMIFIIAVDRYQARIIKEYVSAILDSTPLLRKLVRDDRKETITLRNKVTIEIKTNSYRSIRGFTCLAAILEETAFWRSDMTANPDREVVNALRPALGTIPESLLISISTPYSRRGILYDSYQKNFGKPGRVLVWKAPSIVMNPTLDKEIISAALREDSVSARSEWECEWRADIEGFLGFDSLQACVVTDRTEIPPLHGVKYTAMIDPSLGGQDSFTLAIAHAELGGQVRILDFIREAKPGFRPEEVVREFAALIKSYRCFEVISDRFSREWVKTEFEKHGVRVSYSKKSVSELYLDFLPLVTSRAVELLDHRRLIGQLGNLERRVRSGGRDLVTHFPGQHDDLANAAAGVLCYCGKRFGSYCGVFGADEDKERERAYAEHKSAWDEMGMGFKKSH